MIYVVYLLDCFYTCAVTIGPAFVDENDAKAYVESHPGTTYDDVPLTEQCHD
jgi:hypothetical protein